MPVRPFRIVIGELDEDVEPTSSRALYDYARSRGGSVKLISAGATAHGETLAWSYTPNLTWFEHLAGQP